MRLAASPDTDPIEGEVILAVNTTCKNLSDVLSPSGDQLMPTSVGSSLVFFRRALGSSNKADLRKGAAYIPTMHLLNIFEERRCELATKESLKLFCALSSHALTRTSAGWAHEKSVHERLGMGGKELTLFREGEQRMMWTSNVLLPSTLAGLKGADVSSSFYWMPSVANFLGVDSVLGDTHGQVYAIQATFAGEHNNPIDGIKKVWGQVNKEVREGRTWHLVFIVDDIQSARVYLDKYGSQKLGQGHNQKEVYTWVCDLRVR